jgi:hypothetical protein
MSTQPTPRLRRADSFFGVHFDFHANDTDAGIGQNTTPEMIEAIISALRPDYIQIDCKGHPGWASYPTQLGNAAPGVVADALRLWREVTARHGVALYMHYSGVWDACAVQRHPDWARVDENEKPDAKITSVFGPYVRELLIPQLKELRETYDVDGVWLDGECWAMLPDYHEEVLRSFREATGIVAAPKTPADPHYFEFLQFCRESFRRYVSTYVETLHRAHPNFQIASNWMYTTFMPEKPEIAVDFLSGDYAPMRSVDSARWEARYLASQGKPWDLMAWSFSGKLNEMNVECRPDKEPIALAREAAIVLALGGGFQFYARQLRDGAPPVQQAQLFHEVAAFCRARQPYCHRSEPVPQIGVLLSTDGYYHDNATLFQPWGVNAIHEAQGILTCLLDGQHAVDVVSEHHLESTLGDFPLMVIPPWSHLAPAFIEHLLEYARRGGALLLVGPRATAHFREHLGLAACGEITDEPRRLLHAGRAAGVQGTVQAVTATSETETFGRLAVDRSSEDASTPAATIAGHGAGRIGAVHFDFGKRYNSGRTALLRDFVSGLVERLCPEPLVRVRGSHLVDVTLRRKEGALMVHLINTGGPHNDPTALTFDEIPPLGPLAITVRGERPSEVSLLPEGTWLPYEYSDGVTSFTLPRLEVHATIAVR